VRQETLDCHVGEATLSVRALSTGALDKQVPNIGVVV
jgi:hypothetical protein